MYDEEFLILLLGTCGFIWFLLPLVLLIVLWTRVGRLDRDQKRLEAELLRLRTEFRTVKPTAAAMAPERPRPKEEITPAEKVVTAEEIEVVTPPPKRPPKSTPQPTAPRRPPPVGVPLEERTPESEPGPSVSLEEILAGRWLTWVGAAAVVIAAGLAFRYAINNQLIGEAGRVAIGIIVGMVVFAGGAFAMLKEYRWLSQGLVGAAIGILYFSIYAAYDWYDLWPRDFAQEIAFFAMFAVTVAALAFSTIYRAQPTAILGLLGGFLVPFMLSSGHDRQWELFAYIFVLDLGVLGIASFRKWQPLQLTAFFGTLLIWLTWFAQHYDRTKNLDSTVILMTAFFLLFALLGVWHNTLRRLPARPGDFFLMLATPIVYFAALYGVTRADFSGWQGLMAVGLAGAYLGLAVLQLQRNPAGKMVIVCLAGVAASFLTIAIPLQLTGHWIAIAWAAEALLLVELGLRFGQPKLRWAGFGLLIVVQLILVYYSSQTFVRPDSFQTQFTRTDPVVQEALPSGVIGNSVDSAPLRGAEPSWTDVFNGRSLSFLASAIVLVVLACEYRRRREQIQSELAGEAWLPDVSIEQAGGLFLALVPLTLLGLLIVETFAIGHRFDWIGPTILGLFIVWSSLAALALVILANRTGPVWLGKVGQGVFALAALFLMVSFFGTLSGWRSEWTGLTAGPTDPGVWAWFLINPRSIGYLFAIGAAVAAAFLLHDTKEQEADSVTGPVTPSGMLGMFAHLTGLALLTTEVYAQGVIREWETATSLAVTGVWTLYATGTLIAGIYYRSAAVRILALALFLLTAGKVFAYDVWYLHEKIRYMAFGGLGVSLLLVSFLYRRFSQRIRAWITTSAVLCAAGLGFLGDSPAAFADDETPEPLHTLQYRWPMDVSAESDSGLRRIVIPPDLYNVARNDLGDLRIIGVHDDSGTHQDIPFVLNRPADRNDTQQQSLPLLNQSLLNDGTQFLLDLSGRDQPVEKISIDISRGERNYERTVRVYGAERRDAEDWGLLTNEGYLLDRTRNGDRLRVDHVEFPRSQFAFYKVVIENAGQPPLQIDSAAVISRTDYRVPRHEYPTEILSNSEDDENRTVILFELDYDNLPTAGLQFDVSFAGDYHRSARLEVTDKIDAAEDEDVQWRSVTSLSLYYISRTDRPPIINDQPDFSETRSRYFRLTIENGDDEPLRIDAITALGIDRWLVCEGGNLAVDGGEFALYAGDELLPGPQYDLTRTIGDYDLFALPEVVIADRAPNPFFDGPTVPKLPWSEENAPLLWMLTVGGVLLFGGLTVYLLYKTSHGKPQQSSNEA